MEAKTFEIRDRMTFIPMLAVRLYPYNEADRYLLERAGFGQTYDEQASYVVLVEVNGGPGRAAVVPWDWGYWDRTHQVAHGYIVKNWESLHSGDVVDVEFILGETAAPKRSERLEHQPA